MIYPILPRILKVTIKVIEMRKLYAGYLIRMMQ